MTKAAIPLFGALCLVFIGVALGISQPSTTTKPTTQSAAKPSLVFRIHHFGGNGPPTTDGIVMAGWDDGLVVFAAGDLPAKDLLVGWIPHEKIEETLTELTRAGFFEQHQEHCCIPDEPVTTIHARGSTGLSFKRSHELNSLGYASADAKPEQYKFARMWQISRNALRFARPHKHTPIDESPDARKRLEQIDDSWEVTTK